MRRRLKVTTQALLLMVVVLVLVLGAGFACVAWLLSSELDTQYEQRALGIARSVAADPAYAHDIVAAPPSVEGDAQQRAEQVRRRTGALFVVVTDNRGIRYSHPNRSLVGQRVSTDPSEALAGREVVALQRGTLGLSARGKVPLRDSSGAIVGEASVGIDARAIHQRLMQLLRGAAAFGVLALLAGGAGAVWLARRLKRQTLGLEPTELSELVREHEAVLHGVQDGVVSVDRNGRVGMANGSARELLGPGLLPGAAAADVLPARLADLVRQRSETTEDLVLAGERALAVTLRVVERDGRDLGAVLTLRDRTHLEDLGRELDTVRALFDALRAQSHEYTNRLHTLAGLLQLGHVAEAQDYLQELSDDPVADGGRLRDPYVRGLLAAKAAAASERGVQLRLTEGSELGAALTAPLDTVTILGNLVDNAVRAAAAGSRRPAWVDVALALDGDTLNMAVSDSGDGVGEGSAERVFEDGWTTAAEDGRPHGLGLALARLAARRHGGEVRLVAASGPDHGAVFAAELRHAVGLVGAP
ncbi:MAG: ATP-binding protein [Mycobacteriales bacterium]